MFNALRSFIRFSWISYIAVIPVFAAVSLFAQSVTGPSTPVSVATPAPTSQALTSETNPAPCKHSAVSDIPLSFAIQARVTGPLDSARLKVGKEVWVNIVEDVVYPGCKLNAGSALYAHVTAAASGTDANASELSLSFDHADCEEQRKKGMPLRLIALVGPSEDAVRIHEELPIALRGSNRNVHDAVKAMGGSGDKLNTGGLPLIFRPGIVIGIPALKLEVEGGPGCSSRISSTNRNVQLDRGTILILVVEDK
ncbi:MAG: hypothetical protein ABSB30_05270 [Terracidiphilus sp.]|jgi:hypothetical protein